MGLTLRDIFLVSPELALAALAIGVVLMDLVLKRKRLVPVVALAGLAIPLALAIVLWMEVDAQGAQVAFHGSLIVDKFAIFFKFLLLGILALVLLAGSDYVERFRPYQAEFVGLVLFSTTGLMLLPAAGDLITLYLSLELASLPVVALAAFVKSQARSLEAGIKYLLLSAISSAVLLYGFAFLYGATGTIRIVSTAAGDPSIAEMVAMSEGSMPFGSMAVMVGAVLATAGFGFKLSMVPFQMWTPDVYEGAPTPVAAFLATASKAAAFAVLLRLFYTALGPVALDWSVMFAVLAVATMTIGNIVAIAQTNIKRLLGYSTIAHAGYMLIGVAAIAGRSQEAGDAGLGVSSVLFYLCGYAAMNLAAFFVALIVISRTGDARIEGFTGLSRRAPLLAFVFAFAMLSLIGIPPTVGFMGKLFLFNAAVNADLAWLAVIGVVNSVVSAYYYLSIVRLMYLREPSDTSPVFAAPTVRVALAVTSLAVLVLGLWPGGLFEVAQTAAASLVP
ncbi:MAG: NADH-quinone oxidoreductase subunit N [Dehalococcoidia bacterium]